MIDLKDVDPSIKRLFPWLLFLLLAAALSLGAITLARADISCEEVVTRVGLKPLWLAERIARHEHPELTEAQIAWGRKCVRDYRRAVRERIENALR